MTSTLGRRGAVVRGPFGLLLTGPPPLTVDERVRKHWPLREANERTQAAAPPFEGHSEALGGDGS